MVIIWLNIQLQFEKLLKLTYLWIQENLQEILIEDYQEGFIPDDSNYSTDYSDEEDLEPEEETVEEIEEETVEIDYSGESM